MFKLRFAPFFARQREEVLAQRSVPKLPLPRTVERCLQEILEPASQARSGVGSLWLRTSRAVGPLLLKAVGVSLAVAVFSSSSALVAARILKSSGNLGAMLALSLGYFVLNAIAQYGAFHNERLRAWVGLAAESYLAGVVSRKLARLSARAAARQSSGNLKVLVTSDVRHVGQFLDNFVRNFVPAMISLVVMTPLLIHFAGRAGLIGVGVMVLVLPVSLGLTEISLRLQRRSQLELDAMTSLAGEWVKNVRLIRYLCWDSAFERDVAARLRSYMTVSVWQHFMACLIFGLSVSWWMLSVTAVVLSARAFHVPLDLVSFFGALWLLTFLAGYMMHLPNTIRLYGEAAPSMDRIAKLMAEEEQQDLLTEGRPVAEGALPRRVIFDHVSFAYPDGTHALRGLSLELDLSAKLAVIGEIGSGKTTFLKLLCGELPPSAGEIRVVFDDGSIHPLWTRSAHAAYRGHIAFVPQEPFVSSDLLSRNISLLSDSDENGVLDAAYWAELEADLAHFPRGVAEELGEGGVNLSGGQRQRLNIARAWFSRRPFLLLDDPLSAVDTRTETRLMEKLESCEAGFVLVTHRTGELMRVEEVVVLCEGRLVERGAPQELAAREGSRFMQVLRAYEAEAWVAAPEVPHE